MRKVVLLLCLALPAFHRGFAQFYFTADLGQVTTTYGDPKNGKYKEAEPSSPYGAFGLGMILFGHSQRTHGVNFSANFDAKLPFAQQYPANVTDTSNLGNPIEFGFSGLVNYRYKAVAVGAGLDVRDFLMTNDPSYSSAFDRPDQWLIGIPVIGKVTFGPGGRAYVQGGGTFYVSDYASTTVTDQTSGISATISNGIFALDPNRVSNELRIGGGYMFGHWGLRANYSHRDVYFMVTGVNAPEGFYDMQQNLVSGGFVLTTF